MNSVRAVTGQLQQTCTAKAGEGISLSSFGVGTEYNEDLMQALAENGNGNYYFIQSAEDIPTIFSRELKGLLAVTVNVCDSVTYFVASLMLPVIVIGPTLVPLCFRV
jgi:secreted protein with Ig-like and vWFA domain